MDFQLTDEMIEYLKESEEETIELLKTLCKIPAPSNHEEKRAEFVKNWLISQGAEGVYIDSALNVLYPVGCEKKDDIVLFLAHTDTVFPDMTPMPVKCDDEYIYSPGVGDDTACLVVIMMIARYIAKNKLQPKRGILFAANSGEEGLGNLKGIRQIMKDYDGRIKKVYSFDANYMSVINKCVGSHRYEITLKTEGGHSFNHFGNRNAIYAASDLICRLYNCEIPSEKDSCTTFNVGCIEGGTSVNTIAQNVKILYEYRSDNEKCLSEMKTFFEGEIEKTVKEKKADVEVKVVGIRPCSKNVDENILKKMSEDAVRISEKYSNLPCKCKSGSTDCNIPMSMGIPAIAVGSYLGSGMHTREESVLIKSIPVGLKIAAEIILKEF